MVVGLVLITQGVLTLQPTKIAEEKKVGQSQHASFQSIALLVFLIGASVIVYNKISHNAPNFTSWHGRCGLVTLLLILSQATVGALSLFAPSLLGGESQAKSLWKYHRMGGYITLTLAVLTAFLGTQSDWMKLPDHYAVQHDWLFVIGAILILFGIAIRIRWSKMKFY